MMRPGPVASILLEGELVLECADCGELSTASTAGANGWTTRRKSALVIQDLCAACSPRGRAKGSP